MALSGRVKLSGTSAIIMRKIILDVKQIFCFGELLLRLSPELNGNWIKQNSMPFYIGGAELNAATALAKWNLPVSYCTALPENYLSKEICSYLKEKNIDANPIIFSGNRIGTYYLPQGADPKQAAFAKKITLTKNSPNLALFEKNQKVMRLLT